MTKICFRAFIVVISVFFPLHSQTDYQEWKSKVHEEWSKRVMAQSSKGQIL